MKPTHFLAILTAFVLIAVFSYHLGKNVNPTTPQTDWRAIFTEVMKPLQNKIDSLQRLKDTTVYVYRNRIDTIRPQPFTATVAMLDTMFADTVRYTDSTLLLTHKQGNQVGVWYAERLQCFETLAYTEQQIAIKDTIIAEQVEVMQAMGVQNDSLVNAVTSEGRRKRFWRGVAVISSAVLVLQGVFIGIR